MNNDSIYLSGRKNYRYKEDYREDKDYLFAGEYYNKHHFRYPFVERYKNELLEKTGERIINCKIEEDLNAPYILNVILYRKDCRDSILDPGTAESRGGCVY